MRYFYLIPRATFDDVLRPTLRASWRSRSFAPCRAIVDHLRQRNVVLPRDSLLAFLKGPSFSPTLWRAVAGESFLRSSIDMPRVQTSLPALMLLLGEGGVEEDVPPERRSPIQQVHLGSRELRCGGFYRPDQAGYNDTEDVQRLLAFLQAQDPGTWRAEDLISLPELDSVEEREEELEYARDWWPILVELYARAAAEELVIVSETA